MTERKAAEKKCDERGSEEKAKDNKPENLAKKLKGLTLSEGIVKGAVVATAAAAIISSNNCTTEFETPDRDVADDVDAVEADVEIDDIPTDVDVDADGMADVELDADIDDVEEDVELVCEAYDESRTVMMGVDATPMIVGGIGVVYRGPDTSGDALYDIYCGSTVVRSGINVASGGSRTVDVSEQGFRITLRPTSVTGWDTTVVVTVDAY